MTGNPRDRWRGERLRISDADRDQAIDLLWTRYDEGRLSYDTFALRLEAAVHARSRADLDAVLADLPGPGSARRCRPRCAAAGSGAGPRWRTGCRGSGRRRPGRC